MSRIRMRGGIEERYTYLPTNREGRKGGVSGIRLLTVLDEDEF